MEGILLRDIKGEVDRLAPPTLTESWDRCGVEVGDPGARVRTVLVALGPTPKAVGRAVQIKADLLLTHHPLLIKPLESVDLSKPSGQALKSLLANGISLISAHTNLDRAQGGVNDALASALGLSDVKPFGAGEPLCKIAVTAPLGYEERVIKSLSDSGAGTVGDYKDCFFTVRGEGRFTPLEGANPFTGEVGAVKELAESRIEAVVPMPLALEAAKNIKDAHPYEEPAIDLYPMLEKSPFGALGRLGSLKEGIKLGEFARLTASKLGAPGVRFVGGAETVVRTVAVVGGSGASYWKEAKGAGADLLVTGDVGFHVAQDALDGGFSLIDAGHFCSESVILNVFKQRLAQFAERHNAKLAIEVFSEGEPFTFLKR